MNYEQIFKNIDDILWKEAGCSNELDYVEQTSWILFLKYLDDLEIERSDEMALQGKDYTYIIKKEFAEKAGNALSLMSHSTCPPWIKSFICEPLLRVACSKQSVCHKKSEDPFRHPGNSLRFVE